MAKKHLKKTRIDRILDHNIAKIRRKRALKNNNRPIILNNTMLFEVLTELDSVVRGGATGKTKELAQNLSAKARRLARDRERATEKRLTKIKNIRKKLEEKQKEEALKLKAIREERISMLKSEIAAIDKKIAAASHRKEIENRSIDKTKLETKLRILTKDIASSRPMKTQVELEKRVKQAIAIEEAEEGIDKLLEKIAEMQRTNKNNKWEEEISRATQQVQNTEQESNKSAQNLLDFLDKQFYSNIWQQKLEAEKQDYVQDTRISQPKGSAAAAEEPTYAVPKNIAPYWEKPPEATAEPEAEPEAAAEPEFDDIKALLEELRKYAHGKLKRSGSTLRVLQKGLGFNIKKFANDSELLSRWVKEDDGSHVFINNIFDFLINKGFFARNPSKANPDWVIWQKGIGDYLKLLKDYGLQPDSWGLNNQPGAAAEPKTEPEAEPEATAEPETEPETTGLQAAPGKNMPNYRKFLINQFIDPVERDILPSYFKSLEGYIGRDFEKVYKDYIEAGTGKKIEQIYKQINNELQSVAAPEVDSISKEEYKSVRSSIFSWYNKLEQAAKPRKEDLMTILLWTLPKDPAGHQQHIENFLRNKRWEYVNNPQKNAREEAVSLLRGKQKPPADANDNELSLGDITELQDFFQEDKKTISDITDQLMEQLYDTLN